VICDASKLDVKGCLGAPDIVVEILSSGNNSKDLDHKHQAYEEALVKENWINHPNENTFLKYKLNNDNKFVAERLLTACSYITTDILPDFQIDLEELFAQKIIED
jgi:Uma2 family endonuclease